MHCAFRDMIRTLCTFLFFQTCWKKLFYEKVPNGKENHVKLMLHLLTCKSHLVSKNQFAFYFPKIDEGHSFKIAIHAENCLATGMKIFNLILKLTLSQPVRCYLKIRSRRLSSSDWQDHEPWLALLSFFPVANSDFV